MDEVNVGETALIDQLVVRKVTRSAPYLAQQPQHAKAAVIDLELGCSGEACETIGEGVEDVEDCLDHLGGVFGGKVEGYW